MSEWDASGHFWLPESPEEKLYGKLRFSPGDKILVNLEGSFWDRYHRRRAGIECPALNGVLFNGAPCTIFDSVCHIEVYFADQEYLRSEFQGLLLVVGGHFANLEEAKFSSMNFGLSHLDDWFKDPYNLRYKRRGTKKAFIRFEPDQVSVNTRFEGQPFTLGTFCQRESPLRSVRGELSFKSRYVYVATPTVAMPISWFLALASSVRELMMLMTGCGVYTLEITALLRQVCDPSDDGESAPASSDTTRSAEAMPASFQIFLPVVVPLLVQLDIHCFSSRFEDVSDEFQEAVRGWFTNLEILRTAATGFAELLQNDGASEEAVFLRLVQNLEHLHGVLFEERSRYLSKPAWRTFRSWLEEHVPCPLPGEVNPENKNEPEGEDASQRGGLRQLILNRISSLNKISFRSRLEDLFRGIPVRWLYPILNNPHPDVTDPVDELIRAIEQTRNYLTHYDERLKNKALSGTELEKVAAQCWSVLTYWLTHRIGLSSDIAGRMALNSKRAMFLVAHKTRL